jgi:hypothetical protein
MPLEPLRSKVVGAGAPNSDATWLPAPSQAADLLSTKNFYFADRSTQLDLEAIRDIDLESIERDVDIEALQKHLEPLVFGRLPEVLDAGEGHAAFRKLFRLSQLTLEYLLNVQDVLAEGLDKASQACSESSRNAERYRKRAKKLDARVKMLERDLASRRDAAHAYQGLVMSASSRPPAPVIQPMSVTTEPSVNFPLGDATVYVTMPDGTATQHAIQEGTTAADLRSRAGYSGRTYFRGRRLAADVALGDAGVRDGDALMVVQDGLDQGQQEPLDDRIADLERSIRGELAMQVQTQLAALRGSLPSSQPQPAGCLAGDLEDDDEVQDDETNMQTVLTSPFDASQSGFFSGTSPHAGDLRAMETRLSAQMDALEAKMSELMGDAVHRVTLPRATTPAPSVVKSARKTTPRPVPATPKATTPYAGAVEDDVDEEPRDASFEFSCIFGEGWPVSKPKGKLSLVVAPEETISTVRCAVAAKLDLEVDRIRLRDAASGEDIATAADLESADVVCQIVRGELVTDGQVEDLARLKSILGDNAIDESTSEQREALDASIEARRAVWRAVPPAHGAAAATREDVVHLEVRLNALQKLVASIDSTTTWDAEMVAKVDEALSAFGGGLDPAVNAAVARIRARADERAALVAERVAE